jgi:membrane-associated phospholipid phosphatase
VEVPRSARAPAPRWLLTLAAVTGAVTVVCIFTIDQPIARWLGGYQALPIWNRLLDVIEWTVGLPLVPWTAGIVLAVGMIVTTAVPRWRGAAPAWMFVAAVHIVSRIAMSHTKDLTGRLRPSEWLAHGGDTFWQAKGISFPSGHVVVFASVALPIVALYPRLWPVLAIVGYSMLARLAVNAHFVSDVIGAITLVALITWACGWLIRPRPTPAP